jgi:glycosyltransferase involved in cell wall biosynthesis
MRIVHLIQSAAQIYGAERCVLLETLAQKPRGHDVRALICHETRMGAGAERLEDELRQLAIPVDRVLATGQVSPRLLYDLGRALRRLRPDVVHSHSMKTDVLAVPVARLLGIPLVIELHGYLHPKDDARVRLYERLDQWMMRHSDGVVVLSHDYQRKVVGYGVPPARVHLVPSGIDIAGLRAQVGQRALRAELGLLPRGQGPPVVGMVARLSAEKGHDHFLRAVQALRERGLPVRAVLFGEGPLRAELERQIAALGLSEVVQLAGYVPEVADAYRCLDVLVSCSQVEGLPLNLIESMALGVPVVAMAAGGCADIVDDGSNGRLVPLGDGAALAAALAELCGDAALRQRLGEAAARTAEQRYSLDVWAAAVEVAYAAARAVRRRAW